MNESSGRREIAMQPDWQTDDGAVRLYCGDCLDVLPTLGGVDACVTDPPYGIGEARSNNKSRSALAVSKDYGVSDWDDAPASPASLAYARGRSRWQVIFGGNYFELPPARCWLVWDKLNGENDFADCELAWTNLDKAVRRIQFRWHGMIRDEKGDRVHPTQKPIGVMEWCIKHLPADSQMILDPFMGSGTTGVACVRLGRQFIGIERERKYFDIAVKRITEELGRMRLFEPVAKVTQKTMFGDAPCHP